MGFNNLRIWKSEFLKIWKSGKSGNLKIWQSETLNIRFLDRYVYAKWFYRTKELSSHSDHEAQPWGGPKADKNEGAGAEPC